MFCYFRVPVLGVEAGYKIRQPIVLDARDYGVPQRRKRVFILGVREDFQFNGTWPPSPTHGNQTAVPDGSAIANAIDYSLNRWTALMVNPVDGDVPIDMHSRGEAFGIPLANGGTING